MESNHSSHCAPAKHGIVSTVDIIPLAIATARQATSTRSLLLLRKQQHQCCCLCTPTLMPHEAHATRAGPSVAKGQAACKQTSHASTTVTMAALRHSSDSSLSASVRDGALELSSGLLSSSSSISLVSIVSWSASRLLPMPVRSLSPVGWCGPACTAAPSLPSCVAAMGMVIAPLATSTGSIVVDSVSTGNDIVGIGGLDCVRSSCIGVLYLAEKVPR